MKIIVLGPPLSGKSSLVRYLREKYSKLPILDHDQEIMAVGRG